MTGARSRRLAPGQTDVLPRRSALAAIARNDALLVEWMGYENKAGHGPHPRSIKSDPPMRVRALRPFHLPDHPGLIQKGAVVDIPERIGKSFIRSGLVGPPLEQVALAQPTVGKAATTRALRYGKYDGHLLDKGTKAELLRRLHHYEPDYTFEERRPHRDDIAAALRKVLDARIAGSPECIPTTGPTHAQTAEREAAAATTPPLEGTTP